jgi:hypothetical protein
LNEKIRPKIARKPGFKCMSERHRLGIIQVAVVRPQSALRDGERGSAPNAGWSSTIWCVHTFGARAK